MFAFCHYCLSCTVLFLLSFFSNYFNESEWKGKITALCSNAPHTSLQMIAVSFKKYSLLVNCRYICESYRALMCLCACWNKSVCFYLWNMKKLAEIWESEATGIKLLQCSGGLTRVVTYQIWRATGCQGISLKTTRERHGGKKKWGRHPYFATQEYFTRSMIPKVWAVKVLQVGLERSFTIST